MRCQACRKHPATVHLTLVVDEEASTLDLCESCARQHGMTGPSGFALADLLIGLDAGQGMDKPSRAARRRGPKPDQESSSGNPA